MTASFAAEAFAVAQVELVPPGSVLKLDDDWYLAVDRRDRPSVLKLTGYGAGTVAPRSGQEAMFVAHPYRWQPRVNPVEASPTGKYNGALQIGSSPLLWAQTDVGQSEVFNLQGLLAHSDQSRNRNGLRFQRWAGYLLYPDGRLASDSPLFTVDVNASSL